MKKKIFLLACIIVIIAEIILINNIFFRMIFAIILVFAVIFITSNKKYLYDMYRKVPNIMRSNKRNYDEIIVGDTRIIPKAFLSEHRDALRLDNNFRNYYTDKLVIERWYSMLKPNGIIYLITSENKVKDERNKISIFDNKYLHEVTLMEHGSNPRTVKYKLKEMFVGAVYLFALLIPEPHISNIEKAYTEKHFTEINNFCKERYVNLKVLYAE